MLHRIWSCDQSISLISELLFCVAIFLFAHKNYSNNYQVSNIHNVWYFFERLVCLPKNSTCLVLWETHLSYHCLANLYFQGKSYSKLKFSNMRTQYRYLYNHKLGNFSIIIVYETFNIFCLYFSIQNSSHFSMLGLGDIVSNIKMYIGKRLHKNRISWIQMIWINSYRKNSRFIYVKEVKLQS